MEKKITFDISIPALIKIFGVILGLLFLFLIRDVLLVLFIALALFVALDPIADFFQTRLKIHRAVAVSLIYVVLIGIIILAILLLIPPLVTETNQLIENLPGYFEKIAPFLEPFQKSLDSGAAATSQDVFKSISEQLGKISSSIFSATLDVFGGVVSIITILVISFYMLVGERASKQFILSVLPVKNRELAVNIIKKIGEKVGGWARGQMLLSLAIFIATLIGLLILRIPYALPLAIFAGITELIPVIGPFLGALPAVLIAFTINPWLGAAAIVLYVLVQQLENHVLVPNVMKKTVGLSPVVVIIAILVGAKLMGILGVFVAVPVTASLAVLGEEIFGKQEGKKS
jgi:predicted PurR-regulated permease PerM